MTEPNPTLFLAFPLELFLNIYAAFGAAFNMLDETLIYGGGGTGKCLVPFGMFTLISGG